MDDNLVILFFYFSVRILCCDPTLEQSPRDSSNDESQHTFYGKYGKLSLNYSCYPIISRALDCGIYLVIFFLAFLLNP